MNNIDNRHFANLERKASAYLTENSYQGLVDLGNFPFKTLTDINKACQMKSIHFEAPYHPTGIFSFGTINQRLISLLIIILLIGSIIGNIGLAIINQKWIFLLGALLAIFGFLISTPYSRVLPLLIAVGVAFLFAAFFKGNLSWISLSSSFLVGILSSKILRSIYTTAIINRALSSEPILCYLLLKRMIVMVEFETKSAFNQLPSLP